MILTSLFTAILVFLFVTLIIFYLHFKLKSQYYWKNLNVPHNKPYFLLGNTPDINYKRSFADVFKSFHLTNKSSKIFGVWLYTKPCLVVTDVELIKKVLIRDFKHFHDRGIFIDESFEPLLGNLFFLSGAKWRNLRVKLTPTFTSGKIKMMFHTILDCSQSLKDYLVPFAESGSTIDVKEALAGFTTDIIGSCAFGMETKTIGNKDADFRKYGRLFFDLPLKNIIAGILYTVAPQIARKLRMKQVPNETSEFFLNFFENAVKLREENNIRRNDFLQLIIDLINKGYIEDADAKHNYNPHDKESDSERFTIQQAAAQAFVFFIAGFETSSTTMMLVLYELSLNVDIQEKTYNEISTVLKKHDNTFTYEALQEMTYLDQVVQETLRKYPPVPSLIRQCTEAYHIPELNTTIEKDTLVFLSVSGVHQDPEFYPDPDKFDPDRFAPGHQNFTLSFGEGPRTCIGNRFGLVQTKSGLASVIKNFRFEIVAETPIPIKFKITSFFPLIESGMPLKIFLRK